MNLCTCQDGVYLKNRFLFFLEVQVRVCLITVNSFVLLICCQPSPIKLTEIICILSVDLVPLDATWACKDTGNICCVVTLVAVMWKADDRWSISPNEEKALFYHTCDFHLGKKLSPFLSTTDNNYTAVKTNTDLGWGMYTHWRTDVLMKISATGLAMQTFISATAKLVQLDTSYLAITSPKENILARSCFRKTIKKYNL